MSRGRCRSDARACRLESTGYHLGHSELIADTAHALGRMYDGIAYRGPDHRSLEVVAGHAAVPVWNGLTGQWHPTRALGNMLTILEHADTAAEDIRVAYVGDGRSNVANSLLVALSLMGMSIRSATPPHFHTPGPVVAAARAIAGSTGAQIRQTTSVSEGVEVVDFIYTDRWLATHESPSSWEARIEILLPYRVDQRSAPR